MSVLETARQRPDDAKRARVALARLLLRAGRRTTDVVAALRDETGISRRHAFRLIGAARSPEVD